jgi:hypothetical protein
MKANRDPEDKSAGIQEFGDDTVEIFNGYWKIE